MSFTSYLLICPNYHNFRETCTHHILLYSINFTIFLMPKNAAGSNLGPGASCWKVGSYMPMPGGLQCTMH